MSKILGTIIGIAAVVLLGFATFSIMDGNSKATDFSQYDFYSVISADEHNGNIGDHVKGSADAPVLIFEYADYQCPGCASMNPKVNKMIEALDGKVAVVYRNFLLSYHQNGTAAASAAEAASLQGFWKQYADTLFAKQSEWEYSSSSERTNLFKKYFNEVTGGTGDVDKFVADLGSDAVSKKIDFDMGIGKYINIEATPAFFIDGQYIDWSEASSIVVNGKTISWDKSQGSEADFIQLFKNIAAAKLGE